MKLKDLLHINIGSMVSIVGAGGKSSLMYTLAEELRQDNKVLVTTTTKIYNPEREQYDYIKLGNENFRISNQSLNKGIYVYGSSVNEEGKLIGLSVETLLRQCPYFDYILIEADGSKGKQIKGWNDTEPVICSASKKTIGVISIEAIGQEVNEKNVHRVEKYIKLTNSKKNEIITIENIISLIFHPKGLFKNSKGEKIIFINKVESEEQMELARKLLYNIIITNEKYQLIDKVVMGSLKKKHYIVNTI